MNTLHDHILPGIPYRSLHAAMQYCHGVRGYDRETFAKRILVETVEAKLRAADQLTSIAVPLLSDDQTRSYKALRETFGWAIPNCSHSDLLNALRGPLFDVGFGALFEETWRGREFRIQHLKPVSLPIAHELLRALAAEAERINCDKGPVGFINTIGIIAPDGLSDTIHDIDLTVEWQRKEPYRSKPDRQAYLGIARRRFKHFHSLPPNIRNLDEVKEAENEIILRLRAVSKRFSIREVRHIDETSLVENPIDIYRFVSPLLPDMQQTRYGEYLSREAARTLDRLLPTRKIAA